MKTQGTQYPVDYEATDEHKKILDYAEKHNLIGSEVQIRSRSDDKQSTVTLLGFWFECGSLMAVVRFSFMPAMVYPIHYSRIVELEPTWD
jgi:hypothetical protein